MNFCSGADCLEDVQYTRKHLKLRPGFEAPCSDTVARAAKELVEDDILYTSKCGGTYKFNPAEKLNCLLLDMLIRTGQLRAEDEVTLDFDHEFIPAEKYDAQFSYKKARGYFPGVATIGDMIVGIENRVGR